MSKVPNVTVNHIDLRKISSKSLTNVHIFAKPYVKCQHLGRNALKWLIFSSGMESTHQKKYFLTLPATQSNTFTVCKLPDILSEMLEKAQRVSATNWAIKNYCPWISFYHSEILTQEKKSFSMIYNLWSYLEG